MVCFASFFEPDPLPKTATNLSNKPRLGDCRDLKDRPPGATASDPHRGPQITGALKTDPRALQIDAGALKIDPGASKPTPTGALASHPRGL